jgi:hypothetical protein
MMNANFHDSSSGNQLAAAATEELYVVAGSFNNALWNHRNEVIFFPTGIAYLNTDRKGGGFLPDDGSAPITWKN